MSGPKYSRARIDRYIAEQLLKAEQERLEAEKRNRLIADIKQLNLHLQKDLDKFREQKYINHLSRLIEADVDSPDVAVFNREIRSVLEFQVIDFSQAETSEQLAVFYSKLQKKQATLNATFSVIETLDNKLEPLYEQVRSAQKTEKFQKTDWTTIKTQNYQAISPALQEEYRQALLAANNVSSPTEYLNAIQDIFHNSNLDDAYKIKELHMRRQAVETEAQVASPAAISDETDYVSLCMLLGKNAEELPQDAEVLHQKVEALKKELEQRTLADYVGKALRDSMTELGYEVCESTTLTTRTRIIEKEAFDYTPNSFINVASSTDGAIMFEVVGKEKAAASKTDVCQDMKRFCPDYSRVKEKLEERGIVLTDEKLYPPSEEYVRFVDVTGQSDDRRISANKRKKMYIDG